jgi:hypothetical protein
MTSFSDEQQAAIATLILEYPNGITLTDDRIRDIAVCDSLVDTGHAVRIESDDVDGVAYQLSPEMAEAHRRMVEQRASEAEQN